MSHDNTWLASTISLPLELEVGHQLALGLFLSRLVVMSQHVVPYQENEDADYDELEDDVDGEDTSNFHVMNRLPAPSAVMYRMEDLHKLMHIGEIDLDPPYQRGTL